MNKARVNGIVSFSRLLASVVKVPNHIKCLSLNNRNRFIIVDLNPAEYNQISIIIYLWLIQINIMEVVTLMVIYQLKYQFGMKQKM